MWRKRSILGFHKSVKSLYLVYFSPKNAMKKEPYKPWWQPGLVVFAEVTGWIAVPIIGALFLGRYLDERNNSEPWFLIGFTAVALTISSIGIVSIAGKYIRQIEKESKKSNSDNINNGRSNNNRDR